MYKIDFPFKRNEWYPFSLILDFSDSLLKLLKSNNGDISNLIENDGDGNKYKIYSEELIPFLLWGRYLGNQPEFQLPESGYAAADIMMRSHEDQANIVGLQVTCAYPDWDAVLRSERKAENPGYIAKLEREELDRNGIVFRGCKIARGNDTTPVTLSHGDYVRVWELGVQRMLKRKFENKRYNDQNFILLIAVDGIKFDLLHANESDFIDKMNSFTKNKIYNNPFQSIYIIDTSRDDTVWKIAP